MPNEIEEHPLPEFIIDFIGERVARHIGLSFVSILDKNQSILLYGFVSEQYCLMIQKAMIKENKKEKPEPIIKNINPQFAIRTMFDTLHLFSKEHQIEEKTLKAYRSYLESFSIDFFNLLIDRRDF
jgi:hypothetical protein